MIANIASIIWWFPCSTWVNNVHCFPRTILLFKQIDLVQRSIEMPKQSFSILIYTCGKIKRQKREDMWIICTSTWSTGNLHILIFPMSYYFIDSSYNSLPTFTAYLIKSGSYIIKYHTHTDEENPTKQRAKISGLPVLPVVVHVDADHAVVHSRRFLLCCLLCKNHHVT